MRFSLVMKQHWIICYLRYINYLVLILGLFSYGIKEVLLGLLFSYCFTKVVDFFMKRDKTPTDLVS